MKSTCSIFAAKAFCSLLLICLLGVFCRAQEEENYSLWPKRPDTFAKARKLAAEGKVEESMKELEPFIKEKGVIGKEAKAMLGELRIRQALSPDQKGMEVYTVVRGDAWLRVAQRTKCPLDYLMHVNQLTELGGLQIGQKIKYRALNYRVEINVPDKEVSVWDGDSFIKSYPIVMQNDPGRTNLSTKVKNKSSNSATIYSPEFAASDKVITLSHGGLLIESSSDGRMRNPGFYLKREDCNELALLVRPGNDVEIIRESR